MEDLLLLRQGINKIKKTKVLQKSLTTTKIGELERWDYLNPFKVVPAWISSSNAIKKAFLEINSKKESELEKKYYYLLSKATMEFIVYLNAEASRYGSMGLAYLAAGEV